MEMLSNNAFAFAVDGEGLGIASANPEENTVPNHTLNTRSPVTSAHKLCLLRSKYSTRWRMRLAA